MLKFHRSILFWVSLCVMPAAWAQTVVEGKGSTFVVSYDPIYTSAMQAQMNDAVQFWADWLRSDVPISVDIQAVSMTCDLSYNSHLDWQPPEAVMNFANAPLANTWYPVALANAYAGYDLRPSSADVVVRYNRKMMTHNNCAKWYLGKDGNFSFDEYNLYRETIQELGHHLGLAPLGNLMNGEMLNGYPDIYWSRLKSVKQDKMLTELTASEVDQVAHDSLNLAFKGEHSFAQAQHLTFGLTADALLLFSRSYNAPDLTGLHLHESTKPYQIAMLGRSEEVVEFEITKAMMEDLGWKTTRNSAPIIEGQNALTTAEDQSLTLSVDDFDITDEDIGSLALTVEAGANYQVNGQTIIPAANFNGTLSVPVQVADFEYVSETFVTAIQVTAVNDAPNLTDHVALATDEDTPITLALSDFTVSDVDSAAFSLIINNGDNYSVDGLTVIPADNFNGQLTVNVQVSDGVSSSNVLATPINVAAVNDASVITDVVALSTDEDTALTLSTAMLSYTDAEADPVSLIIHEGPDYEVNGLQIIPAADFHGTLSVDLQLDDGTSLSNRFTATLVVNPINDAPVLGAIAAQMVQEDTSFELTEDMLSITDPDSTDFVLNIAAGDNYQVVANTIVPNESWTGDLEIAVRVKDEQQFSNTATLALTVVPVNDPPVLSGVNALTMTEDTPLSFTTADFVYTDIDSENITLEVSAGEHYTFDGSQLIPAPDFNGELNVRVRLFDGLSYSNELTVTIPVTAVNDAPVVTAQQTLSVDEDNSLLLSTELLTIEDVDSDTFTLSIAAGANYQSNGLTITPAADYAGELTVPVSVSDGSADSAVYELNITVNAINDAPMLTGYSMLSIDEDTALELSTTWLQFSDVDSNQFTVVAQPGEHYSINNSQLVPDADFAGTLNVDVQISDGLTLSNALSVPVTVNAVNDAPVLNTIAAQTIAEDSSLIVSEELLSITDPDSDSFTIDIAAGEHYQVAGAEIIPDANWFGTLTIELTLNDGELNSNTEQLELTVAPVNDLPLITTETLPDGQIYRDWSAQLSGEDIESENLTFSLISAPVWVSLSVEGELSAFPDENMIGEHPLEIAISDGSAQTSSTLILTVMDDPTATDLAVELVTDRTIWAINAWVPVDLNITNNGPMTETDAIVSLNFPGEWTSRDSRCISELNECRLTADGSDSIRIDLRRDEVGSQDIVATVRHFGLETQPDNNQHRLTLTFTDSTPTSPQYTVPSFGQGTVRAIGLANIQGGRWPEILFANGPAEASTAYRFQNSLLNPVLHTHLADSADSYGMAVVDLDNDGHRDWVLANAHGEGNTVYRNLGDGQFELIDVLGNRDSRGVAYADIDLDGDIDLVFANNEDPNTLYLNKGNGIFELAMTFEAQRSRAVLVYDFNRDGRPDIIFANRGKRNRIHFNRGFDKSSQQTLARSVFRIGDRTADTTTDSGSFDAVEFGSENSLTTAMVLADLDGDGIAGELVLQHDADGSDAATLETLMIDSRESPLTLTTTASGSVSDLSTGDYDGDGRDDVAVLRPGGALEIMSNSQGRLAVIDVLDTNGADTILMVDVDGSGKADVISANNSDSSSRLDFSGEVRSTTDTEAGSSAPITLPETSSPVSSDANKVSSGKGGAGLPLLLLPLLLLGRRKAG